MEMRVMALRMGSFEMLDQETGGVGYDAHVNDNQGSEHKTVPFFETCHDQETQPVLKCTAQPRKTTRCSFRKSVHMLGHTRSISVPWLAMKTVVWVFSVADVERSLDGAQDRGAGLSKPCIRKPRFRRHEAPLT